MSVRAKFLWSSTAALALAGCTVGPNFHTPAPPKETAYDRDTTAITGQTLTAGNPKADWWRAFNSPQLDTLVDEALKANTDLAAAQAALKVARESWQATRGIMMPTVDASAGTSRNQSSQYLSAPLTSSNSYIYSLQTAQVNVGYTLDIFGLNRRTIEQSHAQYDMQAWQTQAARVSLINNVTAAAFLEASLRGQLAAQERTVAIAHETLDILKHQQGVGQAAGGDVMAQEAALAQAEAGLPPLRRQLAQTQHLLAYLTGRSASNALPDQVDLATTTLPADLPLSLPSELVRQRPDIRAAEANLHAASAAVGVAIANRLPQLTLSASLGGDSGGWSNIFSAANRFWTVGAGVAQPIFAGGQLLHKQRAARAAYEEADAQYRSTVLAAFQNVADTLTALRTDADAVRADTVARDKAEAGLNVMKRQYQQGAIAFTAVLVSEATLHQAEQTLVQAQAARLTDTAALFQALGGGWDQAEPKDLSKEK